MSSEDRTGRAYHEAGHALLAVLQGILGEGGCRLKGEGGETQLRPASEPDDLRRTLDRRILVAAAGREAQCLAAYKNFPAGSEPHQRAFFEAAQSDAHDEETVRAALASLGEPDDLDAVQARFEAAALQVDRLLAIAEVWAAVEAIKDALLSKGEIRRDEIEVLVRREAPDTWAEMCS